MHMAGILGLNANNKQVMRIMIELVCQSSLAVSKGGRAGSIESETASWHVPVAHSKMLG